MSDTAFGYADRVQENTSTSGTGTITLGGAVTGYQSFSTAFSTTSIDIYYAMVDSSGNWEAGIGTYTGAGGTVTRNTVLSSSNSGSLANFSGSGQTIWVDLPAKAVVDRGMAMAFAMRMVPQ